ncbi:hypothetical protein CORC01_00755 [Colletotrichum orchidophilum]|uniref:Uncharacterized protein n=1 Tax=Colletotrichum orchidophilum TaxID=1209926 RepID=A0A1G4BRA1_9PEZI|nr:uncharacterized protein CORC01_00755 [Colletotrichum orchidophilum]OHF03893.1 hypothetical protein CORC01_00755 [Colletotrichum orchidophilum]
MCELQITRYKCGHTDSLKKYCPHAFDACRFGIAARLCAITSITRYNSPDCCYDPKCLYCLWQKRWVCHKCKSPNKNTPTCELTGCNHPACTSCEPLVSTSPNIAQKETRKAKRDKPAGPPKFNRKKYVVQAVAAYKRRQRKLPRVPVYDPKVGDWV